ncbi:MAG: carbon-nitrogen hydrolase family protein [Armatimonadetes bacterium]|nr:carbon-nitrogen hydrolase family protein [Armatimonadota bacterium]
MVTVPTFGLAMAQMPVEGARPERNLARAAEMIHRGANEGAVIVVLPEALDLGWTSPAAPELAEPIPGPRSDALASAAADANVYVVAGLTERAGRRVYNSSVLISPGGELLLRHRKINILDIAQNLYAVGNSLAVAETPLGGIAIPVCADNFSSSLALGHSLARMGARMILSPCAWAVPADYDNDTHPYGETWLTSYGELARLYDLYVIGVSNVGWISGGPWDGRKCIGRSLAVGPGGEVIAHLPYGVDAETLVTIEVTPAPAPARGTAIAGMLEERGYEGP